MVYDGPEVINESDPFSLSCYTSHFPVFKWRRNGGNIDFANSDSISSTEGRNETSGYSNLMIKSVISEHGGNYKCTSEIDDYGHNLTIIFGKNCASTLLRSKIVGFCCSFSNF